MANNIFNVDKLISKECLENSIKNYFLCPHAKIYSVDVGNHVGSGLLSKLIRLNLVWNTGTENVLPTSVVVKIRSNENLAGSDTLQNSDDHTMELGFDSFKTIHLNECNFYRFLGKIVPIPVPKCFYSENNEIDGSGVIVMEDMNKFTETNIFDAISMVQLYDVTNCLTKLHAWSLNTEFEWRKHFKYHQEYFSFYAYLSQLTRHTLRNLKTDYPSYFADIDDSVIDFAFDKRHIEVAHGCGVITHGDLWIHNILFDQNANKVGSIVDWQFANIGNFTDDIARLMAYSVSTEIRQQNQRQILLNYYECLKSALIEDAKLQLPNFDEVYSSYEISFACQAFYVICDFSLLLEECSQMKFDTDDIKQSKLDVLLRRGAATLQDAQLILKNRLN